MPYASRTIGAVIDDVNRSYFLPAIQRPYVWSSGQITALFDSLLKGYPISSFMFWAVDEQTKAELRCYKFIENYRPDGANEPTSAEGRQITLVLDGQQRLTSLLIGLRGTFSEKTKGARYSNAAAWSEKVLFLDLLKDPDPRNIDEDDGSSLGVTYGLAFHDRRPSNNNRHHWFKVGSILDYESEERLEALIAKVKTEFHPGVSDWERGIAEDTLRRLHRVVWRDEGVNFYTEHDQSADRVLDIFVRANDGGTKLSKADLLMSMITSKWSTGTAREDIGGLVEKINKGIGTPNKITRDLVLKACLVVCDYDVVYNVRNFTTEAIAEIERNWDRIYQIPRIFPEPMVSNRAIAVAGVGHVGTFSTLMLDRVPTLEVTAMKGGSQCFPLTVYDQVEAASEDDLFSVIEDDKPTYRARHGITDVGLAHFQAAYSGEAITKDDIFYYTYGLLHSEDYRRRFADNLTKELPRIPCVKKVADFRAFVDAGRRLGDLHVKYESVEPYPVTLKQGDLSLATIDDPVKFFRVEKMTFGKGKDRSTIAYNSNITLIDVPLDAYDYVVNGKPAIDWVMERQAVRTDKDSGIVNDANDYANETVGDPRYPFDLLRRVITVSIETMKIVRALPPLDI